MILSNLLTLFKVNVSYLELFYSILKVLGFEIYLRFFFSIHQTYRIFYLSRRLFAKHHSLNKFLVSDFQKMRARSSKIRVLSISKFFVY